MPRTNDFGRLLAISATLVLGASAAVAAAESPAPNPSSPMMDAATESTPPPSAPPDAAASPTAGSTVSGPTAAEAAPPSSAGAPKAETRFEELPSNPALAREPELPPPPPRSKRSVLERLDLGARVGVAHRAPSGSEVTVAAGPSVGAHVRIAFIDWLGLTLAVALERHSVSVAESAFGFEGLVAEHGALELLSMSAEVDPRLALTERWSLHGGLGLAWNRLQAGELAVTEPAEFGLDPRTGVLLEAVISPRLAVRFSERFGLSLWGRGGIPIIQSGDVFASGESELQTVRIDNGQLLSVGGFPDISYSLSGHLSVDVHF